jgi:mannose-6-phosphate isomerase-like protein (cupin superfamily)
MVKKLLPVSAAVLAFSLALAACSNEAETSSVRTSYPAPGFILKQDAEVTRKEPGPHEGTGETTAYRYFDEVKDARVIFRKRALHPGASIGLHKLKHDEVYYVISGRGELMVDGATREMGPGSAAFMWEGANVGIRQMGDEDLVIIVSYPPATEPVSAR